MKLAEQQLTTKTISGSTFLDEVKCGIPAPSHTGTERREHSFLTESASATAELLDPVVMDQLRLYVKSIANCYREHSFHSFEHCSHVTMSAYHLLNRITASNTPNTNSDNHGVVKVAAHPLTQLAILLSALVHDVEHPGVPNTYLVREQESMAQRYHEKSVAEQHSLEIAWNLLMQDCYEDLRRAIYWNKDELQQFRSVLVTAVLATDIADPALNEFRNARWNTVFQNGSFVLGNNNNNNDKNNHQIATSLIIECIMQASDIAHTMQHFQVYTKWNKRLFQEMDMAYRQGRTTGNPIEFWYKGELRFFDGYVIPLVKKLTDCGIFGGAVGGGEEYLKYAVSNRAKWEEQGQELLVSEYHGEASRRGSSSDEA
jgi:3'5'-cyclic nucleotide phosphodiesterase